MASYEKILSVIEGRASADILPHKDKVMVEGILKQKGGHKHMLNHFMDFNRLDLVNEAVDTTDFEFTTGHPSTGDVFTLNPTSITKLVEHPLAGGHMQEEVIGEKFNDKMKRWYHNGKGWIKNKIHNVRSVKKHQEKNNMKDDEFIREMKKLFLKYEGH